MKNRKLKIALSQRIIPHYRIPVFTELSKRSSIDLTVFYGKGFEKGSQANSSNILGFNAKKLFTVPLVFKRSGEKHLRVWHPGLFFHLVRGWYDIVIVEPSTNFYNNIFSFFYCKLFRKKFVWYDAGSEPEDRRSIQRKMIEPFISFFIRHADSFITYTSYADQSLIKYYKVPAEKIFRAQNTVDTSNYSDLIKFYSNKVLETKKYFNLNGDKISLYIGGIEKRKRINDLITATANLNSKGLKAKTLIVGDGRDMDYIISNMSEFERKHTIFAGKHIDDSVLYILISDVVVLPAQGGLSVTQAYACGKPFIGSEEIEHGGIKDYVNNGQNGYLIREGNVQDLQNKLEEIFTNDQLYNKLKEGALETSKKITIHKMVDGIIRAIDHAVDNLPKSV